MSEYGGEYINENKYALSFMEDVSLGPVLFKNTFKATSVSDGHEYAIRKVAINYEVIGKCSKEIEILKKLDKNFIVPYDEWWVEENYYIKQNYQDVNTNFNYGSLYLTHYSHILHIKLPLYSLTLRNIIDALRDNYFDQMSNTLTPCGYFVASQLFIDIANAVNYLHQLRPPVYHRNLKPENIMLTIDGSTPDNFVRLSDISLTALDSEHCRNFSNYNAPEVNNFGQFSAESDVFSLGIIAYQLFNNSFSSAIRCHDDVLQVKHQHLNHTISKLMSVFIENRQSCAEVLHNKGLWSLCHHEIADDSTFKDIVFQTKQITSKEEEFIVQYVQAKSKQKLTTEPPVRKLSAKSNSEEPVSPNKLNSPQNKSGFIYTQPKRMSTSNKKPIFLSYARRDASPHARSLKTWLNHNGCEVFLDVDEIKVGNDWQGDLNNAVISCVLFVALVTPTYGTTKWTKREIQLADTLDKHIIPISFIDNWPPVEIAINLLSTHYIPWKTDSEVNESKDKVGAQAYDFSRWEEPYVQKISKEISDKLQSIQQRKYLSPLSANTRNTFTSSLSANFNEKNNEEEISIVFSCHPNDHEFANQLRDELLKFGYNTWLSTDDHRNSNEDKEQLSAESAIQSLPTFSSTESLEKLSHPNTIPNRTYRYTVIQRSSNCFSDSDADNTAKNFRDRVNKASLVVIVLSEHYCKSETSKQQAFYCYQRVPVIAIKYDSFQVPNELTKVYEEENIMEKYAISDSTFVANLKEKIVKLASMPKIKYNFNKFNGFEDRMYCLAQQFRTEVSLFDENSICVYIANNGKPLSTRAQSILKEIGKHLASIRSLKLITGDYNSAEVLVSSFIKEALTDANVYHILPEGMNALKGQTLNVGQSVKERDAVVSQLFNYCLLIDNGDEAIRVAENFSWNDQFVIPVVDEDIDENKHSLLPQSMKDVPIGVNTEDWKALFGLSEPEYIASAVINIITSLNNSTSSFDAEV